MMFWCCLRNNENDLDFAKDNEIKESDQDDMVIERLSHLETNDD